MRCLTCALFLFSIVVSQKQITAYYFVFDTVAFRFETQFLNEVIRLYNRKNVPEIKLEYQAVNTFSDIFTLLKNVKRKEEILSISTITITDDRKKTFDFSEMYIPIKRAVFIRRGFDLHPDWLNKNYRIGYILGTTDEKEVLELAKGKRLRTVPYTSATDKINGLQSGDIDIMLSELTVNYYKGTIEIVSQIVSRYQGYGIMFAKGSKLRKKLEPYVRYYIKSPRYYSLLKESYGNDIGSILYQHMK